MNRRCPPCLFPSLSGGPGAVLVLLLLFAPGVEAQHLFLHPQYPILGQGVGGSAVVTGDLNSDGILDFVSTNGFFDQGVNVYLGVGDGSFSLAEVLPTAIRPNSAEIADLNGDSIPDIAVATGGSPQVSVFYGNGQGSYSPPLVIALSGSPQRVRAADIDGDGDRDLVVCNTLSGRTQVLLGDGVGGFVIGPTTSPGDHARDVDVGDLNGDGVPDLVVARPFALTVGVSLGDGTGGFLPEQQLAASSNPYQVSMLDVNLDGFLDLVMSGFGVPYLPGDGSGSFGPAQDLVNDPSVNTHQFRAGDMNGDGILDLASSDQLSATLRLIIGDGAGGYTVGASTTTNSSAREVATGDLDGDGVDDVLLAISGAMSTAVFLIDSATGFEPAPPTESPVSTPSRVIAIDLNGDGAPDLIYGQSSPGSLVTRLNDGSGNLGPPANTSAGLIPNYFASGDVNLDGNIDLVVGNTASVFVPGSSNAFRVFLGDGNGGWIPQALTNVGGAISGLELIDVTIDGVPDLLVLEGTLLRTYTGSGSGAFVSAATWTVGASPADLAVGDFDSDTVPDVAVVQQLAPTVSFALGNGDGSFTAQPSIPSSGTSGTWAVESGDFDGNGTVDLAVITKESPGSAYSVVDFFPGTGTGAFGSNVSTPTGDRPERSTSADLDGDGIEDLAIANRDGKNVSVLLGSSSNVFSSHVMYGTPGEPFGLSSGDLDRDGGVDLVVLNTLPTVISIHLNQASGAPLPPDFIRGDTNSDGTVNIADAVFALSYLFLPGSDAPSCLESADANGDGQINVADAVTILSSLFVPGSPPIPAPHPNCGPLPQGSSAGCDSSGCP